MQEIAKELNAGRGYIIATEAEIKERFGENFTIQDDLLHIWTIYTSITDCNGRVSIDLIRVR